MSMYMDDEPRQNPNIDDFYCVNPKCSQYHKTVWRSHSYDPSTGISEYYSQSSCKKCGFEMRDYPIEPYEMLSEDFCAFLYDAIKRGDWGSEEFKIYERVLALVESKRD